MGKAVSCVCGWEEHGTEEDELIEAFVEHVRGGHGKEIPRAAAAARITREAE